MNEEQNSSEEEKDEVIIESNEKEKDDLETYLSEMKSLETDFSDLDDLDFEELQEMQDAIAKVKELDSEGKPIIYEEPQLDETEFKQQKFDSEDYEAQREAMITDFSDLEDIDFDELREMRDAIETVKSEEDQVDDGGISTKSDISSELEDRIKQELLERKVEKDKAVITPEKFLEYLRNKRDKIWYHALYYLVFQAEDNIASKELLYEMLKENTSKSPIDPLPEHQFFFGLGYILRLTLNEKKVVKFIKGGKFKINIGVKGLKEMLEESGEPINTKPILKEEEKRQMFEDFLKDDFSDVL
jgi:hypothetical protein